MEYRPLGRTGLSVSAVGFGCGGVGGLFVRGEPSGQRAAAEFALEAGVNYFDTAAAYGEGLSEQNLGRVLRELDAHPLVGTKIRVQPNEIADADRVVREKLAAGLARLGMERVEVLTIHGQVGGGAEALSVESLTGQVADALDGLKEEGLVDAFGFTGLGESGELLKLAASGRFDTFQCYFNVLNQSAVTAASPDGLAQNFDGLLDVATSHGLAGFCIRPLAGGALSATATRHPLAGGSGRPMARGEEYDEDLRRATLLESELDELDAASVSELALRFALSEPRLSCVLVGISDRDQIEEAVRCESLGPLAPGVFQALRGR